MRRFISIALVLVIVFASISRVWANEPQEDLVQSSQEIKFRGIAIEYHEATMPGAPWYWVIEVEEVISGPLISGKRQVITEQALPPSIPRGYVDPSINEGDRVEVLGLYAPWGDPNWVTLYGSADYYIAKVSLTHRVYLPIILKDYSPAVTLPQTTYGVGEVEARRIWHPLEAKMALKHAEEAYWAAYYIQQRREELNREAASSRQSTEHKG